MIGITGGIGSGKSTIAQELARRGFSVYDCDAEAKRIIAEDTEVRSAIVDLLGEQAFAGGEYNTTYVAKQVFDEPKKLQQLNAIVHPAVARDILQKQPDFVESAILYEAGMDQLCDKIIVVDAPEDIRIARTLARDYHGHDGKENIEKVKARMRTQKSHRGDILILNDGQTSIHQLVDNLLKNI